MSRALAVGLLLFAAAEPEAGRSLAVGVAPLPPNAVFAALECNPARGVHFFLPDFVIYAVNSRGVFLESVEFKGVVTRERFRREGDRFVHRPRTGDPVFLRPVENRITVRVRVGAEHTKTR